MWRIAALALVAVGCEARADTAELEQRIAKLEADVARRDRVIDLELSRFRDPAVKRMTAQPTERVPPSANSWWWCLTGGNRAFCAPEAVDNPPDRFVKSEGYGVILGWDASGSMYSAEHCNREAKATGGTCVSTRFVVCATHDASVNVCFATWADCEAHIKIAAEVNPGKPRECAAYFSGARLR